MKKQPSPACASCNTKECRNGRDCFGAAGRHREFYADETISRLHKASSAVEARHYCKEPRLRETMIFAGALGCRKLGLAFCVGLEAEAKIIAEIFSQQFEVVSVCCKVCGLPKSEFGLEQIHADKPAEIMCNPAGQAELLNGAGTDLNVICGLCVGHDAIFSMGSKAPVTTLIAKDRVLAHNPIGAVYSQYIRRNMVSADEN